MATQNILNLNFNLRNTKATKPTPINLIIRYNSSKYAYPTAESIFPKHWQGDKTKRGYQRAKQGQGFVEFTELNARLENIENEIQDIFRRYKNDNNNEVPKWEKFKGLLDIHYKRKDQPTKSFIPFVKQFISDSSSRTSYKTGKTISIHTIKKYKTTLNHLNSYIAKTGNKIDFENIDITFHEKYTKFLIEEYKLAVNSINKDFTIIKFFLNEATERGINLNLSYKSNKFKTATETSDSIYLTETELKLLYELDLSKSKTYNTVRDLFLIGCYTGLRYSDYNVLTSENIIDNNSKIKITTKKTGQTVIIPIHPIVKKIFEKYNHIIPKGVSNQKTNRYLKEIASEIVELKTPTEKKITKAGIKEVRVVPKYKLISTHTARRSFATNLFLSKFPAISIMKITGHATESAFMRYIKFTAADNANALQEHWSKAV